MYPCANQPVKVRRSLLLYYYDTIQDAYDTAGAAEAITIQAQAMVFPEDPDFDTVNVTVTLKGGYPCDYILPRIPDTVVQGKVTVWTGTLVADGVVIK